MKIAMPRFEESVAPCFGHTATICLFVIDQNKVIDQVDFRFTSREPLDRVRLLKDQGVELLICGGMQDRYQAMVEGMGIRVISWVSGEVDALLERFLQGKLKPGDRCGCDEEPGAPGQGEG